MYEAWENDGDTTMAATPEDLKIRWQPGFNLERDTFVVETLDGQIVGFDQFENHYEHAILEAEGYVHPRLQGVVLAHPFCKPWKNVLMKKCVWPSQSTHFASKSNEQPRIKPPMSFIEKEGYVPIRYYWRMEINLRASV